MICNIKRRSSGGVKVGTLDVGSIIQIAVDGTMKNFIVVNQGVPGNNNLYGAGCDGTWMLMQDCSDTDSVYGPNTSGSKKSMPYAYSRLDTAMNTTFYARLSDKAKSAIFSAQIVVVDNDATYQKLERYVFALSLIETGFFQSEPMESIDYDGAKLEYFQMTNDASPLRISNKNGVAHEWWMRSRPQGNGSGRVVTKNGGRTSWDSSSAAGVRPAFVLDPETIVAKGSNNIYTLA
nr:MAG TPA: tail protein [Caudoviricetes sp.]